MKHFSEGHSTRLKYFSFIFFVFFLHHSANGKIACSWQTSQIICNDCTAEQEKCSKNIFSFYGFTINVKKKEEKLVRLYLVPLIKPMHVMHFLGCMKLIGNFFFQPNRRLPFLWHEQWI